MSGTAALIFLVPMIAVIYFGFRIWISQETKDLSEKLQKQESKPFVKDSEDLASSRKKPD
jgi:hypothetical protein